MAGVCRKAFGSEEEDVYQTVSVWGNPVFICNFEEKFHWRQTQNGREPLYYRKENYGEL